VVLFRRLEPYSEQGAIDGSKFKRSAGRSKTQERKANPTDNDYRAGDCHQGENRSDNFNLPHLKPAMLLLSDFLPTFFARKDVNRSRKNTRRAVATPQH